MARWILLGMTILGFGIVFTTHNPTVLGIGLLLGIIGFFGFILALAADRIAANARPDASMASGQDIMAMRKAIPARTAATPTRAQATAPAAPATARVPPSDDSTQSR
jgi:hypothetical protein